MIGGKLHTCTGRKERCVGGLLMIFLFSFDKGVEIL